MIDRFLESWFSGRILSHPVLVFAYGFLLGISF
jgi:hypothetical protein